MDETMKKVLRFRTLLLATAGLVVSSSQIASAEEVSKSTALEIRAYLNKLDGSGGQDYLPMLPEEFTSKRGVVQPREAPAPRASPRVREVLPPIVATPESGKDRALRALDRAIQEEVLRERRLP